MKSNTVIRTIVALGVVLTAAPAAAQQDIRTDKIADPVVIIAMDTSGSLEFLGSEGTYPRVQDPLCVSGEFFNPLCNSACVNPAPKPRHVVAKEVLTGVYENYSCKAVSRAAGPAFDNDYLIPHFEPSFSRHARETGLIRRNRELVRFAFASFDGQPTTGDANSYTTSTEEGRTTWNLGIRGYNASNSPLIPLGDLNDPQDGLKAAFDVESSVSGFIPHGATPLAAMVADLEFAFTDDAFGLAGDKFADCREVHVVLITDGQPTFDDCAEDQSPAHCRRDGIGYPYKSTLAHILDLRAAGAKVHVIGFDVDDVNRPCRDVRNDTKGVGCIHQMAFHGGTDAKPGDADAYAHIATDAVTLTRTLSRVLNGIVDGTASRASVTTTTRTANRNLGGGQYQFFGSFDVSREHHLWAGNLQRLEQKCSGGELQTAEVVNFQETLNQRSAATRRILTPFLDRNKIGSALTRDAYIEFLNNDGNYRDPLLDLNAGQSNIEGLVGAAEIRKRFSVSTLDGLGTDYVLDLIRGNRERAGRRLGGINHAHTLVVGGPELDLDIPGYERFANTVSPVDAPRATMAYQAAATGLHAFNAESSSGREEWLFFPQELQDDMVLQRGGRIQGIDSAPVAREVRMYRGAANPPDGFRDPVGGFERDDSNFYDIWATVLVGGLRGGGRAFYALDVSYPTRPRFLWEINPETEQRRFDVLSPDPFLDVTVDKVPNRALMGYTHGRPAIGTVVIAKNGKRTERGIAILPGGRPENPKNPQGQGHAIYVVELATGMIIRRFTTYNNDSGKPFTAPVTGSVAAFNSFPGTFISRAFVGDGAGRLLRVDLRSDNPAEWSVNVFHDTQTNSPIQIRPSLSTGRDGRVVVIYGNGDIDNLERRVAGNKVVSVSEKLVLAEDGSLDRIDPIVNWSLTLSENEKLTGTPLVTNSTAYFPTFVPNANDACAKGFGRVWALDFQGNDPNSTTDLIGRFSENGRDFDDDNQDRPNVTRAENGRYFDLNFDSVIIGQLTFNEQPVCFDDLPAPEDQDSTPPRPPATKEAKAPTIIIPVSTSSGQSNIPGIKGAVLEIDPNDPEEAVGFGRSYVFVTSWGAVLD